MNRIQTIFLLLIITFKCYSTEQLSDLLIIGNDSIYLKSFPLEKLEFEKSPFSYGEFNFPHTGCWRGYCATWKIIDNKLALIKVEKIDSTNQKLDIVNFFKQNNYSPKFVDGYVYADWFNSKLLIYSSPYDYSYAGLYLREEYEWEKNKNNVQLIFEKGILKENNITGFDSFKIGDKLSYDFSHFPPGLIKKKPVILKATIIELRKEMVLIRVDSYDTEKKEEIVQIRKHFGNMVDTDTSLINPRYWKKE
jgi:hypothetical protein